MFRFRQVLQQDLFESASASAASDFSHQCDGRRTTGRSSPAKRSTDSCRDRRVPYRSRLAECLSAIVARGGSPVPVRRRPTPCGDAVDGFTARHVVVGGTGKRVSVPAANE